MSCMCSPGCAQLHVRSMRHQYCRRLIMKITDQPKSGWLRKYFQSSRADLETVFAAQTFYAASDIVAGTVAVFNWIAPLQ